MTAPALLARDLAIEMGAQYREVAFQSETFNEKDNTVGVTFSTEARVLRFSMAEFEVVEEILGHRAGEMDSTILDSGKMPFLWRHGRDRNSKLANDQLAVIVEGGILDRAGWGTVRFSRRDEVKPFVQDVRDMITPGTSVGYRIREAEDVTPAGQSRDQPRVIRATNWLPFEVSLTPLPADFDAGVRSQDPTQEPPRWRCQVLGWGGLDPVASPEPTTATREQTKPEDPSMSEQTPTPAADLDRVRTEERAAADLRQQTAVDEAVAAAKAEERTRHTEIRALVTKAKLPAEFADELCAREEPLDGIQVRDAIFDKLAADQAAEFVPGRGEIRAGDDGNEKYFRAAEEALNFRVGNIEEKDLSVEGKDARHDTRSLLTLAEVCLERSGVRTRGMPNYDIASAALGIYTPSVMNQIRAAGGGAMGSTDLVQLAANVANKTALRAYQTQQLAYRQIARRSSATDFKDMKRVRLADGDQLTKLTPHGEFEQGAITDESEDYALQTYGRWMAFTRQLVMNDDLSMLDRLPAAFGRNAGRLEEQLAWKTWTTNGGSGEQMGDGNPLWDASHNNTGTPAAISETSLSEAMAGLRLQTDADGNPINFDARYLVVPAALETLALQFWASIEPDQAGNVNVFARGGSRALRNVIPVPQFDISGDPQSWYVTDDLAGAEIMEYAHLNGQDGPSVETGGDITVDGFKIRARHDFGVKMLDWRPVWKNAGVP